MPKTRFVPSEEQRRTVRKLAGFGVPHHQICAIVGLSSPKLLRQHFRQELSLGPVEAAASVMRTAFRLAVSGKHPSMTIFLLKTRGRWSETAGLPLAQDRATKLAQFVVTVYQPPRSPEEEQRVAELINRQSGNGSNTSSWDEEDADVADDTW